MKVNISGVKGKLSFKDEFTEILTKRVVAINSTGSKINMPKKYEGKEVYVLVTK